MTKNSTDRGEQRNTLLANGYTPLPLLSNGKGCLIKGWSRAEVDADWLKPYKRSRKYGNTGIRCDQLAAFDIDILDDDLAGDAEAIIEDHCGETELCRFGRAPKRLLLYRLDGEPPFRSIRTPKYEGDVRVELLCGNGRQFAAFGAHPSGSEYSWHGPSPLDTAAEDLPGISYATACKTIEALEEWLAGLGLAEESPRLAFGYAGAQEWDLTDDFECQIDGNVITWGELKPQLDTEGEFGNIRREDGEFGDSSAVHFYIASGSGQPCVYDFVRDCTHWDQVVSNDLRDVLPDAPEHLDPWAPLHGLLANWALLSDGTVRHVNDPQRTAELGKWKAARTHLEVPKPNNATQTEKATAAWQRDPRTMRADYAALRPDSDEIIIETQRGLTCFNTYAPPRLSDSGGNTDTLREFIDHLIPSQRERELFLDWHALKLAHPGWRMHALITVTRAHGTGRGTWFQILQKLFGRPYVRSLELSDLIGHGSQSQFNDYLADSLICYVPEALEETEERGRWQSRHVAYEKLKTIIEPQAAQMYIRRKYGKNSVEWVYSSLLLSSNHTDALAIEPGDRRVIVLDNCETALWDAPGGLYERIHDWVLDDDNIGALARELRLRALDARDRYDPFGPPPETPAKARMIEAGQSDADMAFEFMVAEARGDLVSPAQWRQFAQRARMALQLDLPLGDALDRQLNAVITKRARRIETLPKSGIKLKGSPVRPWIIRNFESWKGSDDNAAIRAEILKNGDPGGSVVEFPPRKGH